MIKQIMRKSIISLGVVSPLFALAIAPISEIKKTPKGGIIKYGGKYFNNAEEILLYYLSQDHHAIKTKNVIGDIDNAEIDADYGILNKAKLYDYDPGKVSPVYLKSSGSQTSDINEAKGSYANPVFIREKYEGVRSSYSSKQEAIDERRDLMTPLTSMVYHVPKVTEYGYDFNLNPLNEKDNEYFKKQILKALNDPNIKLSNYYTKQFDQIYKDKTSVLDDNDNDNKLLKLIAMIEEKHLSGEGNGDINITDWSSYLENNDCNELSKYINKNNTNNDERVLTSNLDEYNSYDAFSKQNKSDKTIKKEIDSKILNIDDIHQNGEYFKEIKLKSIFGKYKDENKLESNKFVENLNMKSYKTSNGAATGDTKMTTVFVNEYDSTNSIQFDESDILLMLQDDQIRNTIKFVANSDEQKNLSYDFDLSMLPKWQAFKGQIKTIRSKIENIIGSNYEMGMNIKLKRPKNEKGEKSSTNIINSIWYDPPRTMGKNKVFLDKLNLNYFEFKINFKININKNSFFVSFTSDFNNYLKTLEANKENEEMSVDKLFKNWIETKNAFLPSEINLVKKLKNTTLPSIAKKYKEFIKLKSGVNNNKLFRVNEVSSNQNTRNIKLDIIDQKINKEETIDNYINKIKGIYSLTTEQLTPIESLLKILTSGVENSNSSKTELYRLIREISSENWNSIALGTLISDKASVDTSLHAIIDEHLQSLKNYFRRLSKRQGGNLSSKILNDNVFLENAKFNLSNNPWLYQDRDQDRAMYSVFNPKPYGYIMLTETYYNSPFSQDAAGQVGPQGLINDGQKVQARIDDIVNSTDPPISRIMYNVDGKVIVGKSENFIYARGTSKNNSASRIYDTEDLILKNAYNRSKIWRDITKVYYETAYGSKVITNKKSTVYALMYKGKETHFKSYAFLRKYLTEKLLEDSIIIN